MTIIHPSPGLYPGPGIYPGMTWPALGPPVSTPAPPVFRVEITDIFGTVLAEVPIYSGIEVQITIGEERTGKVVISHYQPAVQYLSFLGHLGHRVGALGRMIRVRYRSYILIWGFVTQPKYDTVNMQVEVTIVGPCYRLMHRELNYSDWIVSPEGAQGDDIVKNPSDWRTMREIVEAAYDLPDQADANVPDVGVYVHNYSTASAPPAFYTQIERGSNNWDKLKEVSEGPYGGEFDVVPYDPAGGDTPFDATPSIVHSDSTGDYVFPNSPIGTGQTAVDIDIVSGGMTLPASGKLWANITRSGHTQRYTLSYTSRDATHVYGVTGYPRNGTMPDNTRLTSFYGTRPYHYADMNIYDQLGVNRTGSDLVEDPDDPGSYLDPYADAQELHLLYDDQDPVSSNLKEFSWEPDGDNTRNQYVMIMAANTEAQRGKKAIARNINSWFEIGVFSDWNSVSGQNVTDVSLDNLKGSAANMIERYGRPPNFFRAVLKMETAEGSPEFGEVGWQPQFIRDFYLGDRFTVRGRQGYMDSGEIVGRIMGVKITQADPDNNIQVELDCVPHMTDISEISTVD